MKKKKIGLPLQILIALVLGIVVGLVCYFAKWQDFTTNYLKPFGDIFVNLLKFIVVPVVLLSMIDGIISMDDMKKVGSVGVKTVLYFLITTAIACVIGLVLANIVADVIIPLSAWVPQVLSRDGVFLCSGIIDTRADEVQAALEKNGLHVFDRREQNGWVALASKK